jgi:hypothetical protein
MHRQYPNIDSDQEYVSWFTQIWPRSRTYDATHRVQGRGVRRASAAAQRSRAPSLATIPRLVRGAASRPILRQALFNRLLERMNDLLGERLTWSRTGTGATGSRSGLGGGAQAGIAARAKMLEPSNYNPE